MLFGLLVFLFLLVCLILMFLVLVQDDKGGGISGAIGGGVGSTANSILGSQNAETILTQGTRIFAGVFFVLTIVITLLVAKGGNSSKNSASQLKEYTTSVSDVVAPSGEAGITPFIPKDE
ncbi:MAG: preprotein translocase subunit SecG [Chitinispirillales bacterium]|jgi:preprotein translocase subunit SecG|nr:preprotein translocase subunit SecG [Chitinispirillales bacterium]